MGPYIQDVSCEFLLRDGPRRTLAGDNLREELGEDVAGRLRKSRRPKDRLTVYPGRRVVETFGSLVGDNDLEVMRQRRGVCQAVCNSVEHARVTDLLYCVPVLRLYGVVLVDDRDPPLARGSSGRRVVAARTGRTHE